MNACFEGRPVIMLSLPDINMTLYVFDSVSFRTKKLKFWPQNTRYMAYNP